MNGLLVSPLINGNKKNIGDYIQSIAQEQYWDKIDCYVEREKLASFCSNTLLPILKKGKIDMDTPVPITFNHKAIAKELKKRTAEFVSKCNSGGESERIEETYHMAA